jgi:hypothetical protein
MMQHKMQKEEVKIKSLNQVLIPTKKSNDEQQGKKSIVSKS